MLGADVARDGEACDQIDADGETRRVRARAAFGEPFPPEISIVYSSLMWQSTSIRGSSTALYYKRTAYYIKTDSSYYTQLRMHGTTVMLIHLSDCLEFCPRKAQRIRLTPGD